MNVWVVRGGRHGELEQLLLDQGVITGPSLDLPDLSDVSSREDLTRIYERHRPELTAQQIAAYVGQWWTLLDRMQVDDLVVMPLKSRGTIAVGRVNGPYCYRSEPDAVVRHTRPVEWLAQDVPRDAFDQDLLYSFGAFLTVGGVKRERAAERVAEVVRRFQAGTPIPGTSAVGPVAVTGPTDRTDEVVDVEEAPDVAALAREQLRQYLARTFTGHRLAELVAAVLEAKGYAVTVSPPGPDRGVDILAGSGPLGMDRPWLVAQVKTGAADVHVLRALEGVCARHRADQGLLVAWGGFAGTSRTEARDRHFTLRLWDADDLIRELCDVYDRLPQDLRAEIPLQQVWVLATPDTL